MGKLPQKKAHWRINNMGWNSSIDYEKERSKPLIAIIGDSYVEAMQVDIEDSYPSMLRGKLGNKYDVYSFGISGASLSQYMQMSRYINKYFDPKILVFNVVHNDFLEALCAFKKNPGWLCLQEEESDLIEAPIKPYYPSRIKRLLRHSSLVRYITINLKFRLDRLAIFKKRNVYQANVDVNIHDINKKKIERVTDYILRNIKKENQNKIIVFIIDGPRKEIYGNCLEQSRVIWLNKLLEEKCIENGFYFIDLTDIFLKNFNRHHKKFESGYDFHWNEWGHQVIAEVLYDKLNSLHILN